MTQKTYLLTPGPTPIPERVTAAMTRPLLHHRTPQFQELFAEVRSGLQHVFQTKNDVLVLAGSGTAAMEATIASIFRVASKVIVINSGKFGERWTKICQAYQMNPVEVKVAPGETLDLEVLKAKIINGNFDALGILFQASETSTGATMPVQAITELAHQHGMLSICDGITACGVMDLPMDQWGIDVMITGSQKAMMIPPGLSFVSLSENAWKKTAASNLRKFYLDLRREREAQKNLQTAWTPATQLVQGLQESLKMIREEGLPNVFARHELLARAMRAGVSALGLEILAKNNPSPAVTAVKVPTSISDGKLIPRTMRDKYGVSIAGGQDALEGQIFRLSHFGYCDKFDVTTALSALELTLKDLGHPVTFGSGVGAALKVFSEQKS